MHKYLILLLSCLMGFESFATGPADESARGTTRSSSVSSRTPTTTQDFIAGEAHASSASPPSTTTPQHAPRGTYAYKKDEETSLYWLDVDQFIRCAILERQALRQDAVATEARDNYRQDMLFLWKKVRDQNLPGKEKALKFLCRALYRNPIEGLSYLDVLKLMQLQGLMMKEKEGLVCPPAHLDSVNQEIKTYAEDLEAANQTDELKNLYRSMAHLGNDLAGRALLNLLVDKPPLRTLQKNERDYVSALLKWGREQKVGCYLREQSAGIMEVENRIALLECAAELGELITQCMLYNSYKNISYKRISNPRKTEKYCKLAATQGLATAQCALSSFYLMGTNGIPLNEEEGAKWLKRAAKQGLTPAQYNLGVLYAKGEGGIEKNEQKAADWFQRAAAQGHALAQYNLGFYYLEGVGALPKDGTQAIELFKKSAEQGHAEAQFTLGIFCAEGMGEVRKNEFEAVRWYQKAAAGGVAKAQFNLAVCYEQGKGVKPNESEAVKWYRKAAEQGCAEAQNNLAICYAQGKGVNPNESEAVKWYRKAAEQGYKAAQYNLGSSYEKGQGRLQKDTVRAAAWYKKAAEQGLIVAKFALKKLVPSYAQVNEEGGKYIIHYQISPKKIDEKAPATSSDAGDEKVAALSLDSLAEDSDRVDEKASGEHLEPQSSQDSLSKQLDDLKAQYEKDRRQKRQKTYMYTASIPTTTSLTSLETTLSTKDLDSVDKEARDFLSCFFENRQASSLKRDRLPEILKKLGCKVKRGTSFVAKFTDRKKITHTFGWHPQHKTTRSSFERGGFRKHLKAFLEGIVGTHQSHQHKLLGLSSN